MHLEKREDSSQEDWLVAFFAGLQRTGFTGVIKVHMHAGGIRGAKKEESIDIDWRKSSYNIPK